MSKESTTKNFLLRRGAPSLSLLCVAHWSRAHCFARVVMMMIIWPIRETFSCLVIYSERNSVCETFPIRRTHAAIRNCAVKHTEKRKSHENPSNRQDTSATSGAKNLQFFMVDRCERKTLWVESLFLCKIAHVSTENDLWELANFHYRRHLCTLAVRRTWWSASVCTRLRDVIEKIWSWREREIHGEWKIRKFKKLTRDFPHFLLHSVRLLEI